MSRENFGCQFYRGVRLIEVSVKRESIVVSNDLKRNCCQGSYGSFFNTFRPFISRKVKIHLDMLESVGTKFNEFKLKWLSN